MCVADCFLATSTALIALLGPYILNGPNTGDSVEPPTRTDDGVDCLCLCSRDAKGNPILLKTAFALILFAAIQVSRRRTKTTSG